MDVSNEISDGLADRAAAEVRERREAGDRVVVAVVARAHGADRQRVR